MHIMVIYDILKSMKWQRPQNYKMANLVHIQLLSFLNLVIGSGFLDITRLASMKKGAPLDFLLIYYSHSIVIKLRAFTHKLWNFCNGL